MYQGVISSHHVLDKIPQVINTIKIILKQAVFYYSPEIYNKLKRIDIDNLTPTKQPNEIVIFGNQKLRKEMVVESS